jgi:hypothetical protein
MFSTTLVRYLATNTRQVNATITLIFRYSRSHRHHTAFKFTNDAHSRFDKDMVVNLQAGGVRKLQD